jgi:putative ABC transport system permease protein
MIRHLARLIWSRRRANALVLVEIFCAFLVLVAVSLLVVQYVHNYRQPLGFDIDRAWVVTVTVNDGPRGVSVPGAEAGEDDNAHLDRFRRTLTAIGELPEVEAVAASFTTPYSGAGWSTGVRINGRHVDYSMNEVTDTFPSVVGVDLLHGRWFDRRDDGAAWRPVVVNARLAREIFGETDVIGRSIRRDEDPQMAHLPTAERAELLREMRVVGVVEDFRQFGEFSTPESYMFRRLALADQGISTPRLMLVKVRGGTPAAFEETLQARVRGVAPDWSFDVRTLDALRQDMLRYYLVPLVILATLAAFLLVMVALGLTGIVWQNVTQRSREIGLRRAHGATRRGVHLQLLAEIGLLTTVALAIGLVLVAQAALLPLPASVQLMPRPVFVVAVTLAVIAMYVLTLGAAWLPSRLAMRVEPAEALRYE